MAVEVKELLEAGVHFGHLTRKWDPNMAPYVYMERNGIHIINLYKTAAKIDEAGAALAKIAASGRKILFVATKKQAKDIVAEKAGAINMPFITERWPGGMLTNFVTIRKAIKKMATIDRMKKDGTFNTLSKKERLQVDRLRAKLEKNLGSIVDMTRLPGALFVVDIETASGTRLSNSGSSASGYFHILNQNGRNTDRNDDKIPDWNTIDLALRH